MISINNEKNLKHIKCQFCYSSTMEELMSFHVMAEPELHPICGDWAMHMFQSLPEELQKEITYFGEHFAHWYYVLDLFGIVVEENANYKCDLEFMADRVSRMPLMEFAYYMLGLAVTDLEVAMEDFSVWYQDTEECRRQFTARHYSLMELEDAMYIVTCTGALRTRLLRIIREYWDAAFSGEWDSISNYVKDIIYYEEMSLSHSTLLEYLAQFHSQLKVEGGYLIFNKEPKLMIEVGRIESLVITPSIFGDSHLHGSIYGGRVNMTMNLNYRALQVSRPVPDSYFQLLRALSDESRFRILKVLWNGDATTKEISDILRLSPSTISLHLKLLKEADLVTSSKIKKFVYYRLKREKLMTLEEQTLNYLKY